MLTKHSLLLSRAHGVDRGVDAVRHNFSRLSEFLTTSSSHRARRCRLASDTDDQSESECSFGGAVGEKFTPGIRIPVTYLRSKAWTRYFHNLYSKSSVHHTTPLFQCPFCWATASQIPRFSCPPPPPSLDPHDPLHLDHPQMTEAESVDPAVCERNRQKAKKKNRQPDDDDDHERDVGISSRPLALTRAEDPHRREGSSLSSNSNETVPLVSPHHHHHHHHDNNDDKVGRDWKTAVPWRTPMHMMAHLSYEHMTDGVSPASLAPYNAHVLAALVSRLRGVDVSRNATPIAAAEPPGRPVVTADAGARMSSSSSYSAALHSRMTSDDPQSRSTENHRPSLRRERPPLRLLVWIDVANVELGAGEVLLEMIRSKAFRPLLQHIPIGWCTTQELFVPHPCATLHAAHQLSCRHPHSDFFPFYALTRVESGDLAMAHLLSQVRRATGRDSPGMVLMTLDALQRQCATELFGWGPGGGGGVITPLAVTPSAMYHAMLQALGDGIG